jgi:predicted esterase
VLPSSGFDRELLLVAPTELDPAEQLPLLFLWHWQQGTAADFLALGDVQNAADLFRFAAVIPYAKGDVTFEWPYAVSDTDARLDEELVFFDDMLACVSEQIEIDLACVSSTGVSAGALMTAQLAGHRGAYLASMLSLSGGVGGLAKGWTEPPHKMPALVLWGGPTDMCLVFDFETTSQNLEDDLTAGGHFLVECIHNCGHAEPPFDVPGAPTPFAPVWQFALDHPYWLEDGASPYEAGLPVGLPDWCAVGQGNAEPREGGGCPEPGC